MNKPTGGGTAFEKKKELSGRKQASGMDAEADCKRVRGKGRQARGR